MVGKNVGELHNILHGERKFIHKWSVLVMSDDKVLPVTSIHWDANAKALILYVDGDLPRHPDDDRMREEVREDDIYRS